MTPPAMRAARVINPRAGVLGEADHDAGVLHFLAHALQAHLDLRRKPR